jgi:hypothetical protein
MDIKPETVLVGNSKQVCLKTLVIPPEGSILDDGPRAPGPDKFPDLYRSRKHLSSPIEWKPRKLTVDEQREMENSIAKLGLHASLKQKFDSERAIFKSNIASAIANLKFHDAIKHKFESKITDHTKTL